jgi:hypothetical protein
MAARSLSLHEQSKIQDPELANHHLRLLQAAGIVSGVCNQAGPRKMDFWNSIKVASGIGGENSRNLLKKTKTALRAPRKIGPGVALGSIHSSCRSGSRWPARAEPEFFEVPLIEPGLAVIDKIGYKGKSFIHAKIDSLAHVAKRLFSVSVNGVIVAQISKASLKWVSSNHG